MASQALTPEVLWAQRSSTSDPAKNHVFLTLMVADVPEKEMKLDLQPTKLTFTGTSTSKKVTYHVELEFFDEIDPKESKIHHSGRDIELVLQKKDLKEEYWPRLLKDSKKQHFLKTNFDKWVDEDEQDEAAEDDDYMSKMNPMGGEGGDGGFGGIDFSKLGAGGGMPGMEGMGGMPGMEGMGGMPGMEGMGGIGGLPDLQDMADNGPDSSASDDDDEMPALEGEKEKSAPAAMKEAASSATEKAASSATEKATETPASGAKIQEVE